MSGSGDVCGNYICADDVDNWPSGTDEEDQLAAIETAEAMIEKVTKTHFYPKAFELRLNGNGKNRLVLPLQANIISVSAIYVWGVELDSTWYTWDNNSVLLDTESYGGSKVELAYQLGEVEGQGLFPRGLNNIHIIGVYGLAVVPSWVKDVAVILVKDKNDPALYAHYTGGSESIGNYSYNLGGGGVADYPTGVVEADTWLRRFRRGKSILLAP
jgi:hypothetical protein